MTSRQRFLSFLSAIKGKNLTQSQKKILKTKYDRGEITLFDLRDRPWDFLPTQTLLGAKKPYSKKLYLNRGEVFVAITYTDYQPEPSNIPKVSSVLVYTNIGAFNGFLVDEFQSPMNIDTGSYILVALEISNKLQNVHLYYYQSYKQRDDFVSLVNSYDIPNIKDENMVVYTMPSPNKTLNVTQKKIVEDRFNGKPRPPQEWTLASRIYRTNVNERVF